MAQSSKACLSAFWTLTRTEAITSNASLAMRWKRLTISALRPYYRASTWESKNIIKPTTDEEVESELDIDEIVADPSMSIEKKYYC